MLWNDILCALCFSRRVNTVNDRKVGVSRDVVQGLGLGLNPGQRRVQGITAISILHPRSLFREMRRIDVLFSGLMGDGSAYSTCSLLELRGPSASRDDESIRPDPRPRRDQDQNKLQNRHPSETFSTAARGGANVAGLQASGIHHCRPSDNMKTA
jgi:hypothetical protein